jgi:FkbM family methyltransferase
MVQALTNDCEKVNVNKLLAAITDPRRVSASIRRRVLERIDPDRKALRRLRLELGTLPRYTPGAIAIPNWDLHYVDARSLLSCFETIVVKRWNDFSCSSPVPTILDCGANIGVASIHYKRLFPTAKITAFEPDPRACQRLRRNLISNGAEDVEVVEAAVWTERGEMTFFSEGADANRIIRGDEDVSGLLSLTVAGCKCQVRTVRLADYLQEKVDFVKLDIEGAESSVISDCAFHLGNVANIVIEYHLTNCMPMGLASTVSALADSGFSVSVGSYGPWVDLMHKTSGSPNSSIEFNQYLLICGWREGWIGAA